MKNTSPASKIALITGASGGIGFELTKLAADNGYDVIMVSRDPQKLHESAVAVAKVYNVKAYEFATDLSDPEAPEKVYDFATKNKLFVSLLINNAGFATYGEFSELPIAKELGLLEVNITALTHLTSLFVSDMVAQKEGRVLNIGSTAAFLPGPLMATYYASKAYVLSFSVALAEELQDHGVTVSCLCPGPTNTGFVTRANLQASKLFQGKNMNAEDVAKIGFEGTMRGRKIIIPGSSNVISALTARLIPMELAAKIAKRAQAPQK